MAGSGYPEGVAATQRMRLVAAGIAAAGHNVDLMIYTPTEDLGAVRNHLREGRLDNVPYAYTAPSPIKPSSRAARALYYAAGWVVCAFRLTITRITFSRPVLYAYPNVRRMNWPRLLLVMWARMLGFTVIGELNELPWSERGNRSLIERIISPSLGVHGWIAISASLAAWSENAELPHRRPVLRVPVLADSRTASESASQVIRKEFTFAVTPQHAALIEHVLRAWQLVASADKSATLVITGCDRTSTHYISLQGKIVELGLKEFVRVPGFLSRPELLSQFKHSLALLAPLLDDNESRARFPTKIAEYLLSGRPVISTNIGEVGAVLVDGQTALLSAPGNVESLASLMLRALAQPDEMKAIGERGKMYALSELDYVKWGGRIASFMENIRNPLHPL